METTARLGLGSIARPSGAFAMVAIDQRESLRTMFEAARGASVPDSTLIDFKLAVTERLAPLASAMLFDRFFSTPAFEAAAAIPTCGRILAGDHLTQLPGERVEDTDIDYGLDPVDARSRGAVALKLLLIWRAGANRERCLEVASQFVMRCHDAGLLGIVEAIVRPPNDAAAGWDREASLVEAARQLGTVGPDLYKCEVPFQGLADDSSIARACERITDVLPCPWVVLSQGVMIADYARALEIACRSGASGFLAGRAVWSDTLAEEDYRARLDAVSVPRLARLVEIVDAAARPWQSFRGASEAADDPSD